MQGGNFGQRPYRRRGRGLWFWIILAFIIISLASGGFRSFNGPSFDHDAFNQRQIVEKPIHYIVRAQPTIVINDTNGNVTVTVGQSNTDVIIQPVNVNNFFGNPNNLPVTSNQSPDGNTINVNAQDSGQDSVNLNVVVPQNANLQLITDSGNISVNGVDGQMRLTTSGGNVNASNDTISGSSTITTDSGNINFDGTISPSGTYQFRTSSGTVDLTVPSTSAFHIDATTSSGSMNTSDFPSVIVQNNGNKASGDVGGSSPGQGAKVIINTDSGDIKLHK